MKHTSTNLYPTCTSDTVIMRGTRTAMHSCAVTCTTGISDTNAIHDMCDDAVYEALGRKEEAVTFGKSWSKMQMIVTCALAVTTSDLALHARAALHARS